MTDPLDLARFQALADAYGGTVARWPESCRDAASRLAATAGGAAILHRASALDERLDTWRIPAPSPGIPARIVAGGPATVASLAPRLRWWWPGVGIAASLAGAVAGTAAVAMAAPIDAGAASTSFGDIAGSDG